MQDQDGIDQTKREAEAACDCPEGEHAPDCPKKEAPEEEAAATPESIVSPDATDPADEVRSVVPKRAALDVKWYSKIAAQLIETPKELRAQFPRARTLRLKGTFIDASVNANKWGVPPEELASIARQLQGGKVQLRLNHSEGVRDVVGIYDGATLYDEANNPIPLDAPLDTLAKASRVDFSARMTSESPEVVVPVLMGYVTGVSPHLEAQVIECGVCGKNAAPEPSCEHFAGTDGPGWHRLRNVQVREGSIVATPAYGERTPLIPLGFAAGVDEKTKELRNMAQPNPAAPQAAALTEADVARIASAAATEAATKAASAATEAFVARLASDKKAAEEAEQRKAQEKAAAEEARKTEARRLAATRQGGAVAPAEGAAPAAKTAQAGRPWGAMAGSLHSDASTKQDFVAFKEMREAAAGKRKLGSFGGLIDGFLAADEDNAPGA